ncbi:Uncharacterized protein TCM_038530 [Theobroma cacao]|uniref:Uncharacterized protein n=1 Tax=Theobroma cacao TaxID=3641 RepID=A0A061GPY1_THECC|nr:Uncharacterized protein TCM_038530 [Theobroma cacao]
MNKTSTVYGRSNIGLLQTKRCEWTSGLRSLKRRRSLRSYLWISFPNLKAHLYEKSALLLIAKTVGKPLFVDEATTRGSRPSVARKVEFSPMPDYCFHCFHVDHKEADCIVLENKLKQSGLRQPLTKGKGKQPSLHMEEPAKRQQQWQLVNKHKRNSDLAVLSLASKEVVDMREKDGMSDDDSISINYAARTRS